MPFVPGHEVVGELPDDCEDLAGRPARHARERPRVRGARRGPAVPQLRGRRHRALRPGHGRRPEGGAADRVLRADVRRLGEAACSPTARSCTPCPTTSTTGCAVLDRAVRVRDPRRAARRGRARAPRSWSWAPAPSASSRARAPAASPSPGHVTIVAKHPRQRAAAKLVGADEVVRPEHAAKAVRRRTSAVKLTPSAGQDFLLGGADVTIECTGLEERARPGAARHEGGRPDRASADPRRRRRPHPAVVPRARARRAPTPRPPPTFDARRSRWPRQLPMLGDMVGATYPLDRWRDAIDHAMSAGSLGTFKVAFAPQDCQETDATMPRPGFVLEVDERTPPLIVHEGEGYRMQPFPLGTQRGLPARRAAGHPRRATRTIRHALTNPVGDSKPLPELLQPGHEAHDRGRRHLDAAAADGDARRPPADPRARDRAGRADRASRTSRSSSRRRCTAG